MRAKAKVLRLSCIVFLTLCLILNCHSFSMTVFADNDDIVTDIPADGEPEVIEPIVNEPEVNEPEVNEPEVNEPEVNEPEVNEPEVNEPEVNEPEVNEPEVNEPEVNEPEVNEPEVNQPEVNEPEVNEPEVNEPEVNEPEVNEPEVNQPEINEPEVNQPEVNQPEVNEPQINEPVVNLPETPVAPGETEDLVTEEPETDEETEEVVGTGLKNLEITCGELVPEFNPEVYEYVVYVQKKQQIKFCDVKADAANRLSSVRVTGPKNFDLKDIEKQVILVEPSGEELIYTIKVHVLQSDETLINKSLYRYSGEPDLTQLPSGFDVLETEVFGELLQVAISADKAMVLIPYTGENEDEPQIWQNFNAETEELVVAEIIEIEDEKYVITADGAYLYGNGEEGIGYYKFDRESNVIGGFKGTELKKGSALPWVLAGVAILLIGVAIACFCFKTKVKKLYYMVVGDEKTNTTNYFVTHMTLEEPIDKTDFEE